MTSKMQIGTIDCRCRNDRPLFFQSKVKPLRWDLTYQVVKSVIHAGYSASVLWRGNLYEIERGSRRGQGGEKGKEEAASDEGAQGGSCSGDDSPDADTNSADEDWQSSALPIRQPDEQGPYHLTNLVHAMLASFMHDSMVNMTNGVH